MYIAGYCINVSFKFLGFFILHRCILHLLICTSDRVGMRLGQLSDIFVGCETDQGCSGSHPEGRRKVSALEFATLRARSALSRQTWTTIVECRQFGDSFS